MAIGSVTIVVDERDDVSYTQAALQAHRPDEGRITVQPTPANSCPAALAHDALYALGKRLVWGPDSSDRWLDSVNAAWLAAAAWSAAAGVRHVVITRTHLLTARRVEQVLAWRERTGVQLTLLWHTAPRRLPPELVRVQHRVSSLDQLKAVLAEPGPIPARPFFAPRSTKPPGFAAPAPEQPPPPPQPSRPSPTAAHQPRSYCAGATATAQLTRPAPAIKTAPEDAAALAALAHPLIAGALSVLTLTGSSLIGLQLVRDIDITGDTTAVKIHGPGHRHCPLHVVPPWARPLLAAARAHHRLAPRPPGESVFAPALPAAGRHLRTHAERLTG